MFFGVSIPVRISIKSEIEEVFCDGSNGQNDPVVWHVVLTVKKNKRIYYFYEEIPDWQPKRPEPGVYL